MLYCWSNSGTIACIDYTNGALDGGCYIGGATLEQQHLLIIPTEHWTEHVLLAEQHWSNSNSGTIACIDYGWSMLFLQSNTGTTSCIDYTDGALDRACYIGGATLEQHHVLIIPTEHWTKHVILAEQHWNHSI